MIPHWHWLLVIVPISLVLIRILVAVISRSAWFAGKLGEFKVNLGLSFRLDRKVYRLFKNVTLPFGGGTAQIDHLVVSPYGIFVIETKSMNGWIFGQPNQEQWMQVFFRFKQRFKNPLLQNAVHVEAVQGLLGLQPGQVRGVVAFVGGCTLKTQMPPFVVQGVSSLVGFIRAKQDRLFTEDEVGRFTESILTNRLKPGFWTDNIHRRYAKKRKLAASTVNSGVACPLCGDAMIEQANRRTGERFLGCRRFPRCRGVRSLR